jgi:hypothetical protein
VSRGPLGLPLPLLLWFGLLGAPFAWFLQHIVGLTLTEAACSLPNRQSLVPVDGPTLAITIVATSIALLAAAASVVAFVATRDTGTELPGARVHFMATVGIVITPILLCIVLMSGVSVLLLPECHQS